MKYFSEILEQFTTEQKIFVLILLLVFSSGTLLVTQYLKNSDCRPLIEENQKLIEDFTKVSSMVRELKLEVLACTAEAASPLKIVNEAPHTVEAAGKVFEAYLDTTSFDSTFSISENDMFDQILKITDQHKPR